MVVHNGIIHPNFIISMPSSTTTILTLAFSLLAVKHCIQSNILATALTPQPQIYQMGTENRYFTFQPEKQDVYILRYTFCTVTAQELLLTVGFQNEDPLKTVELPIDSQSCLILLILVSPMKSSLDGHLRKFILGIKSGAYSADPHTNLKQPLPWNNPLVISYSTPLPTSHRLGCQPYLMQISLQSSVYKSESSIKAEIYFSICIILFLIVLTVLLQVKYRSGFILTVQISRIHHFASQQTRNLAQLNRLIPKQSYKQLTQSQECSICLLELIQGEQTRVTRCLHTFHAECIDHWCGTKMTCPICRASLSGIEDIKRAYLQARHRLFQLQLEQVNLNADE